MHIVGIVSEYNPFHNGHLRQFQLIRQQFGADTAIVCAMSGNYVQRGAPAIFDKSIRAEAAIRSGADLILELPIYTALSSAEGFALGGVRILSQFCDTLSFGAETLDSNALFQAAEILLSEQFSLKLKEALKNGVSFPAARSAALQQCGFNGSITQPNDILATEYCKAILSLNSDMNIFPITRNNSYHATALEPDAPSATAIRQACLSSSAWIDAIPKQAQSLFLTASTHNIEAGERAILAKLRTMTDEEFEALPLGSEGLWRKLMKSSRSQRNLEQIINSVKSKRYTRTRIDRMILCAFLGITDTALRTYPQQTRVLAFSERGRSILHNHPGILNCGEDLSPFETNAESLYGLFCTDFPESPDTEKNRRVFYLRERQP